MIDVKEEQHGIMYLDETLQGKGSRQNSLKQPLFSEVFTWDTTHPSALCYYLSNWPISKESAARLRELK